MYRDILYEVTDPVAVITLNRPKVLNAWSMRMGVEVRHALAAAEKDPAVVGIIITGAGRGFCSGADMKLLESVAQGTYRDEGDEALAAEPGDVFFNEGFRKTYSYLASIPKPVIAAINGPCVGMALPISLYCDLRFASPQALFVSAFAQRGLVAEHGSSWMLPRLVGLAHTMDILLSGRKIDAHEAARMGLVNRVVCDEDLLEHSRTYVVELARNCAPASMAKIKKQVYNNLGDSLATAYEESDALMMESFTGDDMKEGVAAFTQQRPPKFSRL